MIKAEVLAPLDTTLESVLASQCQRVMSEITLNFIEQLSRELLTSEHAKNYPELVALGFWLRKSNIQRLKEARQSAVEKPLGLVVHFTPANVDTMFIYSWVCALLMGNKNVVRLASQPSALQNCLLNVLSSLFAKKEFKQIASGNIFVRYAKQSNVSQILSNLADARVIWGGDDSVNAIRAYATKPRCRDISFANRYSAALINGNALNQQVDVAHLARLIWRDTEPYQQQACSSPRIIYWSGDSAELNNLMVAISEEAKQTEQTLQQLNNHLVYSQLVYATESHAQQLILGRVTAVKVEKLTPEMLEWHTGDGMFLVVQIDNINDLPQYFDAKLQTLSYWGLEQEQLLNVLEQPSITGIDRIVPIGQALDFSPVWDGYDLLGQLSRQMVVA